MKKKKTMNKTDDRKFSTNNPLVKVETLAHTPNPMKLRTTIGFCFFIDKIEMEIKTKNLLWHNVLGNTEKKDPQQQKTHTTRLWLSKNTYTENWGKRRERKKRIYTMNISTTQRYSVENVNCKWRRRRRRRSLPMRRDTAKGRREQAHETYGKVQYMYGYGIWLDIGRTFHF